MFIKLLRWAVRRHPMKSAHWVARKYWNPDQGKWAFAAGDQVLRKHSKTRIQMHVKVKDDASPFNGDWVYWANRLGKHPEIPTRDALLLKHQQGKCNWCGLLFVMGEDWELDHVTPRRLGGKDVYANLQLLHQHCHDQKTAVEGKTLAAQASVTETKPLRSRMR